MDTDLLLSTITKLSAEIAEMKRIMEERQQKSVYTSSEVESLFAVSAQTVRKWRDRGLLGFSQIGSTYLYSQEDVNAFLASNHKSAWAETSPKV